MQLKRRRLQSLVNLVKKAIVRAALRTPRYDKNGQDVDVIGEQAKAAIRAIREWDKR